jgi:hypothetical protein
LYYRIIDRVNRVLQALPNAPSTGAADDAKKAQLKGEALFLRAFAHFELFRFYSNSSVGTDLALKYMDAPSLEPQARETVATFIPKLKADITEAKTLCLITLPISTGLTGWRLPACRQGSHCT